MKRGLAWIRTTLYLIEVCVAANMFVPLSTFDSTIVLSKSSATSSVTYP